MDIDDGEIGISAILSPHRAEINASEGIERSQFLEPIGGGGGGNGSLIKSQSGVESAVSDDDYSSLWDSSSSSVKYRAMEENTNSSVLFCSAISIF